MRAVLDHLTANDELGLVGFGQSNRRPWGDRDTEGYVESPHLNLRPAGMDLTIAAITSATGGAHGAIGTQSIVTVAEEQLVNDWVLGELRLVQHDFGESVASTLRKGHAKVLSNAKSNAQTSPFFAFDLTNHTVLWPSHGRKNGSQVLFTTTGSLPGTVVGEVVYFVRDATEHTFKLALTPGGTAINLVGAPSGIHTVHARPFLVVEWLSEFLNTTAGVTFSIAAPGVVNHTAHNLPAGSIVTFDVNTPPELTAGVPYWVVNPTTNAYNVSEFFGSAPINFTGAGGAATATPVMLAFVSGYVHLHDRFNSYDVVNVVTPYQPIEPGDYPVGTPVVPGFTLAPDITTYADVGLVLPFAWNEGVDGFGHFGTATRAGLVVTFEGGLTVTDKLFAGGFIRKGGAKGKIASNTTTTVTVESWTPTAGPATGSEPFVMHLPHWRNNPHHFVAGEGFLYPSDDMQPGAIFSDGIIYSRPRARLKGSYVGRTITAQPASTVISGSGFARALAVVSGGMTAAIVGGKLRIQYVAAGSNPVTGKVQFEDFLRLGYTVGLAGMGQTPSVDGFWRVVGRQHQTSAGGGGWIDLDPVDPILFPTPGAVAGTVPASATVTRQFYKTQHKFGSLIESAWRLANSLGRRIVAAHLGVNSSSQFSSFTNAGYGVQGKIGWWEDDLHFDWTPASPNSLAARLQRVVEFITPRAVTASLGAAKKWKVLAIDGWQLESDALHSAGRDMAPRTIPTFLNWLRGVIEAAQLSPYPKAAKIPWQWAQLTHDPWELELVPDIPTSTPATTGDTEGVVNAALRRAVALDGFGATIETNDKPKVSVDKAHFNGVGMARNGKAVAEALLPLVDLAFGFALGPDAIEVANEALSLLGDTPNVTALEPPNATVQAKYCAQFMTQARNAVLQKHVWSFATRRAALVSIDNVVSTWQHAYVLPPDLLKPVLILDPNAPDDVQIRDAQVRSALLLRGAAVTEPATQPFTVETEEGVRVLRTNQPDARIAYITQNVDFGVWAPLARQAGAHWLASLLSGPLLKGKTGSATAREWLQLAMALIMQATADDAEYQRDVRPDPTCPWLPS